MVKDQCWTSEELAYIAFGSNLGNRVGYINQMIEALAVIGGRSIRCSSLWNSEASGMEHSAGDFINGVVELRVTLAPEALLDALQQIEISLGRPRDHGINTARVIDLDIISYGSQVVMSDRLEIPHPRAHERLFVLKPLMELVPDLKLCGFEKTVTELVELAPPMAISRHFPR